MLATTLWRNGSDRAFDQLEQGLLHAFTGNIPGDRRVVRLTRDLVDLIDVDNAHLGFFYVVIALLQQLLNDVLDIFTYITRLGEGGCVGDGERNVQQTSQCFGKQGFTRACRADQQDVAFAKFDVVILFVTLVQALVVVVHRYGQNLLRTFLTNYILIKDAADFFRRRQFMRAALGLGFLHLLTDDVVAQVDALVANKDRGAGNQLTHFMLAFATEGAIEQLAVVLAVAGVSHSFDPNPIGFQHKMKAYAGFFKPAVVGRADQPYFEVLILSGALFDHCVDQPIGARSFGAHEVVTIGIALDFFQGVPAVLGHQCIEALTNKQDFLGVNFDVRRLALEAAQRLVNHHARVRQAVTLALGARGEQERAHAAGLTDAGRRHVWLDELHGVVDRHTRRHRTARGVDVKMDVLVRVFRFKEQQLRADQVGHVVLYRADQKDHSFLEQARVDVIGAFATSRLLDNHRDQAASGLDIRVLLNIGITEHALQLLPNSHVLKTHKPARGWLMVVFRTSWTISRLVLLPPV